VSVTVRSYQRVFRVDRRIHQIDRWVLPIPGGLPLRTLGYFVGTLLAILILDGLPLVGDLIGALSPPMRYVLIPAAVAALGSQIAPDGRSAHRYALTWLAFGLRARRRSAGHAVPLEDEPVPFGGTLALRGDERWAGLAPARVRGPARIDFPTPMALRRRRNGWQASPVERERRRAPDTVADALDLEQGEVLEVRR